MRHNQTIFKQGISVLWKTPDSVLSQDHFYQYHKTLCRSYILLAYGIPKETVAAITILYRNTKVKVRSLDGDTEYFDIVAGVLQGDTLAPYLFIICLDYVLRTSIDKIKENGFELTKKRSRRYPATTITDADYADDIAILANTHDQVETLLHSLERAAASIGLYVNAHKTEYMCYNQTGDISTLEGTPLKLVDKFTYLGSSVESTEKDIETRLTKAWTAINRLLIIWKSDLTDKMKRSFFQAAVTSILLYGCTTWTLTKRLEKKLDGNYTRMLRAILNKSWQQHPTRHQLYSHLPPITKTIQVRRTRHAGHCWRSRDELIWDVLLWIPTHGRAKVGRPARTYIQQLCEDTGCCPEDLPRAMNDREEWRERVRDIRDTSAIWWWWWIHIYIYIDIYQRICKFINFFLDIKVTNHKLLASHENQTNNIYIIIIIIMSCRQHGYPWPSLATSPYHSSPPAGLQGYIHVAVCKFELVVLLLHGHMWGSIGVHHLWARPCLSSSVPRVWFV